MRVVHPSPSYCLRDMLILGIDIGGTSIKAGLVNTDTGEIVGEKLKVPTPVPSARAALLDALAGVVKHFGHRGPVGMGFPGVILSGAIATSANMDKGLIDMKLGEELRARTGVASVTLVNDADAAGLGEAIFGGIPESVGMVVVLTLGTGIGGALIRHDRLIPNFEPGRWQIPSDGGGHVDAEVLLSAVNREKNGMSWADWAARFDTYLAEIHAVLWPEMFVLGGGGAYAADEFLHLLNPPCPVHIARLGNDAGIIGAALAAR